MRAFTPTLFVLAALAPAAAAQNTLLFGSESDEITIDNGNGHVEAGLIRTDEVGMVTPVPGTLYSASIFLSTDAQWAYLGDEDLDGRIADSSSAGPGGDTDAVFIKNFIGAPLTATPRDVYVSKEGITDLVAGSNDSDVFRYAAGGRELFITEQQITDAIGGDTGHDLNAICQTSTGDLYISFSDVAVTINGTDVSDGGIVRIPASAITYDVDGNVASVAAATAEIVAQEADVNAMIANSAMLTSVGGTPSTSMELSGLEIDPNGGTWNSPVTLADQPNLLFAFGGFSNDGAILSTAGGGSIATINGVPLASTVATTGVQVGLLPDSSGLNGLFGIALTGLRPPVFAVENFPTRLITSSTILFHRSEVSGATPSTPVVHFVDFATNVPGTSFPSTTILGIGGELFGIGLVTITGVTVADLDGYTGNVLTLPSSFVGTGAKLAFQAFDVGAMAFATPAALDFL